MEMALWLQSVAVMDQQAIFTETFTAISSMEVAQYFHYNKLHSDSFVPSVCGCHGLASHFHRYFHQNK